MKPKAQFTVKVILFTLVLIGGLTIAFMMGIMMAVDEAVRPDRLFFGLIGLIAGILSLLYILKINRGEEQRRVTEAVEEQHEYIGQWIIPHAQWNRYLEQRLIQALREAKSSGLIIGVLFAVVATLIVFQNLPLSQVLLVSFSVLALGFLAGWAGARKTARNNFNRDCQFDKGEVYFARQLIVLNGRLIQIKDFGVKPIAVELESQFGQEALGFKIQTGLGNRKSTLLHWILVPEGKREEARTLCDYYRTLI